MSSIRTRAAQRVKDMQIKESFNQNLVTRDEELETLFQECKEVEEYLKSVVESGEMLQRSVEVLGHFSNGLSSSLISLFSKSSFHDAPIEKISEAHQSLLQWTTETVILTQTTSLTRLLEETQHWFGLFDEVRTYQRQREKTRLVYDHYVTKVEDMQTNIAKKRSRNPSYQETGKEADRLVRVLATQNERKLSQATENFRADSQKCSSAVSQALEMRYHAAAPFVAKVPAT